MKELNQEFARLREYPVGSVCVIHGIVGPTWDKYNGRECTTVSNLKLWSDGFISYEVEVQGELQTFRVFHENLRLKKFPGQLQSWLTEKMNDLLNKVPDNILKEDLV